MTELKPFLTEIADAIREVDGSQELIPALEFPNLIRRFTYTPPPQNQEEFEAASWDEIAKLSAEDIDRLIALGVTKNVEFSGIGTFPMQLVHGSAYNLASGSGMNAMVFLAKDCIANDLSHAKTIVKTVWQDSLVKLYLDTTVWDALPADLRRNIVEVKLPCFAEPYELLSLNCPALTYVSSKLFIPSVPEIFSGESNVESNYFSGSMYPKPNTGTPEGSTYKWFQAHSTKDERIKKFNDAALHWWLRGPSSYNNGYVTAWYFNRVNQDGILASNNVERTDGVVPAFCIGKV